MAARNVDFKTALRQVAEWLGEPLNRSSSWLRDAQQPLTRCGDLRLRCALEALEAVARANEAVAGQIFKALETLHKAQEQLQYDVNEIRKSD